MYLVPYIHNYILICDHTFYVYAQLSMIDCLYFLKNISEFYLVAVVSRDQKSYRVVRCTIVPL